MSQAGGGSSCVQKSEWGLDGRVTLGSTNNHYALILHVTISASGMGSWDLP